MANPAFARLPGFRDFPPEDFALRSHIFEAWRTVSRRYGFSEYEGPPLEPLDLYVEKSGHEIVGQLYTFTDKGDREVALRPEMTPSLARILAERSRGMSKPIRWFTIPQLFRYERQQRGRLREHFQWNVDVVGEEGVTADAEVVAVAIDGVRALGLGAEDFCAYVSDRRLLTALLGTLGVAEEHVPATFSIVDKVGREPAERTRARLTAEIGLDEARAGEVLALFDAGGLDALADQYGDRAGVAPELDRLHDYLGILDSMGLGAFVEVDLSIVRGLAYYTGIVFELFDRERELRSICGGGRYDRLLELVGGEPLPAVGFGMGDVVLTELLTARGLVPDTGPALDYFLVTVAPTLRAPAMGVAHRLRERGRRVAYALRDQAVGKQLKAASKEGAARVVIFGPDEWGRGAVVVRDMATGEEREVPVDELE